MSGDPIKSGADADALYSLFKLITLSEQTILQARGVLDTWSTLWKGLSV
jgi:hypothetical protein